MKKEGTKVLIGLATSIFVLFTVGSQILFAAEPKPQYGGTLRITDNSEGISIGYPPKMSKTTFAMRQASPAIETLLAHQ